MWLKIKVCANLLRDVVSHFEKAVSGSTFCMNNSFWDTLSSEVSHLVHKVEILHEERTTRTN